MNKIDRIQKEYEIRLAKQRKNQGNWTKGNSITIKKKEGFKINHGKYIRGEE